MLFKQNNQDPTTSSLQPKTVVLTVYSILTTLVIGYLMQSHHSHDFLHHRGHDHPHDKTCKPQPPAMPIRAVTNPEEFVTTIQGATSRYPMSFGNTLPLVARPFGMTHWAPKTDDGDGSWFFHSNDYQFYGIRATHQPSPWIGDYGYFTVTAALGEMKSWSGYTPKKSRFSPYYFNASLEVYCTNQSCTTMEVTATTHGSAMRVKFPPYSVYNPIQQMRYVMIDLDGGVTTNMVNTTALWLKAPQCQSDSKNFGLYAYIQTSRPFQYSTQNVGGKTYTVLQFDFFANDVTLWIGTSLISPSQAQTNLISQSLFRPFDALVAESKAVWNKHLSRVSVTSVGSYSDPTTKLTTFYSCMYRASLFPRSIAEYDARGNQIHYSPYDSTGSVYPGELSTDSGFWDAYRAVYPWFNLAYPERATSVINGWLNAFKEGGWIPQWSSPGYRGSMVGTMSDVTIADAIVKNLPGINYTLAYQAIRKDAFFQGDGVGGRLGLNDYIRLGYIPYVSGGLDQITSRSLNYMHADYAISQAAQKLGYYQDAQTLLKRSQQFGTIFDPTIKFFRPKDGSGNWVSPFDPWSWDFRFFTEASAWQYRFYAPWNITGVQNLYGGAAGLCKTLQDVLTAIPAFRTAGGDEIHEETEMASHDFGLYEHNNQPVHHMLYVGVMSQCSSQISQRAIRRVLTQLYTPHGFAGDEDNGEMAAWYLLSAVGLYSVSPGTPDMVLGTPLFENVVISLPGGKQLTIYAPGNGPSTPAVRSVSWNGVTISGTTIPYQTLMQGGTLRFTMMP